MNLSPTEVQANQLQPGETPQHMLESEASLSPRLVGVIKMILLISTFYYAWSSMPSNHHMARSV